MSACRRACACGRRRGHAAGRVIGTGVGIFTDAEGGGRGERVRRVIGIVKVGEGGEEIVEQ